MRRSLVLALVFLLVLLCGCDGQTSVVPTLSILLSPTKSPVVTPTADAEYVGSVSAAIGDVDDFVVYVSLRDGSPKLYASSVDGIDVFELLPGETRVVVGESDWSAAARSLAFALAADGREDIFVADFVDRTVKDLTGASPSGGRDPVWSPDGSRIAYVCGDYEPDICLINADGSGYHQVTEHPSRDFNAVWSPDGAVLLYQTSRGGLSDVYAVDLASYEEKDLTGAISQSGHPSWSASGAGISFHSDREGSMSIFMMSEDGSSKANLTPGSSIDSEPQWAPDESLLAFRSNRSGDWGLYIIRPDGSELKNLTAGYEPVFIYNWSTDGEHLVFTSKAAGNNDIYVVDAGNGIVTQITDDQAADTAPVWIDLDS